MLRKLVPLLGCALPLACGAGAVPPVASPAKAPTTTETSSAPPPAKVPSSALGDAPGVPGPPASCEPFTTAGARACSTGDLSAELASALQTKSAERDARLRCLERSALPPGLIRALRADLAPRECGDAIVGDGNVAGAPRDVADALVGLGVGARLYRSVRGAPLPRAGYDKAAFLQFFREQLAPWVARQAHAVDALSKIGPRLNGYGKAIVALEAGLADMRFVDVARSVQLPEEMKSDPEVREAYLVSLEQALEPRIARGRDAALVGIGELSRLGVLNDARLRDARALLSSLFAGRRIDALDGLLLAPLPAIDESTAELRLAARLPAFYAMKLAASPNVTDPKLFRARLEQGVPPGLWLDSPPAGSAPELTALSQRALFMLGQTYFWAEPFARASKVAVPGADAAAALVSALSQVLAKGPRNAATMMLGPTTLPPELRDTSALDKLAATKGPVAGLAEFDAAYVRALAPPANDPAFWKDQSARYQRAQRKLLVPAARATALDLAQAAQATEKELRAQARQPPKP